MKHVLCFGDSNTWGWDSDTYDLKTGIVKRMPYAVRWPGLAQGLLGAEYRLMENALNARTIMHEDPYNPRRLGIASLAEAAEANAPMDLLVVALGTNELKHMYNLSAGMVAWGLGKLVLAAQQSYYGYPSPKILIIAPAPIRPDVDQLAIGYNFGPLAYGKSLELAKLYKDIADKHGCGYLDAGSLGLTLNTVDGLHYNRGDHAKVGEAAAAKIREMLG